MPGRRQNGAAYEYSEPLILVGDSAGGTLAATVAHRARGRLDQIIGQVLIYPALGLDPDIPSAQEHANAPLLTREEILFYRKIRTGGAPPLDDPTLAPLSDTDFTNLPPTVLITADCDPVRDDSKLYQEALQDAGTKVHWINEPGLVHGYLRARSTVKRAHDSFERISLAIEALGQGLWPYD